MSFQFCEVVTESDDVLPRLHINRQPSDSELSSHLTTYFIEKENCS